MNNPTVPLLCCDAHVKNCVRSHGVLLHYIPHRHHLERVLVYGIPRKLSVIGYLRKSLRFGARFSPRSPPDDRVVHLAQRLVFVPHSEIVAVPNQFRVANSFCCSLFCYSEGGPIFIKGEWIR